MNILNKKFKQQIFDLNAGKIILLIRLICGISFLLSVQPGLAEPPSGAATIFQIVDNVGHRGHVYLAMNNDGHPAISYTNTADELKLAVCQNTTCSNPIIKIIDVNIGNGDDHTLVLNNKGHAVIAYEDRSNQAVLKLIVCSDVTCSNSVLNTVHTPEFGVDNISLKLDSMGFPIISFVDSGSEDLMLIRCDDIICTSQALITIAEAVGDDGFPISSLAVDSNDSPVISYLDTNENELDLAKCNNPTCNTLTHSTVEVDSNFINFGSGRLVLDSNNNPILSYHAYNKDDLNLVTCNDPICTVRTITTIDNNASQVIYNSVTLNSNGHPVISYYDFVTQDLIVATCNDVTCTNPNITSIDDSGLSLWFGGVSLGLNNGDAHVLSYIDTENENLVLAICNICMVPTRTTVDSAGFVGNLTSIDLNNTNHPAVSYWDVSNESLKLATCGDAACSNPTLTMLDTDAFDGSLRFNIDNNPVVSYYDAADDNLNLAVCNNTSCTNPALITVDEAGNVGRYSSLAFSSSGNPVISYYDATNDQLKVAICNNATCTNPTLTIVDSDGNVGWGGTSLALTNEDKPVISYYDNSSFDLKLAVCEDLVCSSATIRTLDSDGSVGRHNSLALNSQGFPVISYWDASNTNLKLVVCNNSTCTQPTITTVAAGGEFGQYSSLALTNTDTPIISYYDATNRALKLAVCSDIACTNPTITTVDNNGWVGEDSALALNSSGFPVISYYDNVPNHNLKIATFGAQADTPVVDTDSKVYLPIMINND